ncbi:hypothetical protein [Pseudomonas juntendi]|uniref:hypothetical protein n=1 Tax=Pseudomonas juntendi TaxID=2666183 RepID=UPI001F1638DD|nr:hypothetical protein [Pseudomonas juntendi]
MSHKKVFTNVSSSPVVLSDGSSVQPGGQTTDQQYELAKGSLWEEHGVLVSGEPKLTDDGSRQVDELRAHLDKANSDLFAANVRIQELETNATTQPDQLKDLQDKLIQEQARSSKLETELKDAQAKLAGKK